LTPSGDAKCFAGCVGRQRGEKNNAAALRRDPLHQKERGRNGDGEQLVEFLDGGSFDTCRFRDAGIGDEDVEPNPSPSLKNSSPKLTT
jgi:hypothetical protein